MIALIIILALVLLILCLSVGADAAYDADGLRLKLVIGPFRLTLLPKQKKPKKKKPKKPETPAEKPDREDKPKKGLPFRITLDDVRELLGLVFRFLGRLGRGLSIDRFLLHLCVAGEDPYAAVQTYGAVNAALGALAGPAHRALHIRREDIRTLVDFEEETMTVEARLVCTLQIWEILWAVLCAACAAAVWFLRKKREQKRQTARYEQELKAETVTKGI